MPNDNFLGYRITYSYDSENNLIEENKYNSNNNIIEKCNYQFTNGIKINGSLEKYNSDESQISMLSKFIYKYDNKGNLIENNHYNSNSILSFKEKYDDKGNITEYIWYKEDGTYDSKDTFKFDDKGNQIGVISFDSNYTDTYNSSSKYEFDKNGNWIKKYIYSNTTLGSIYIRKIEYYQ